jgi:putative flavoprotein involved in K+ transport
MSVEYVDTLVIGAGQAGIAMSEHLGSRGVPHLVLEKKRIAESWRSARWDSLVANGPAWHDRFPNMDFAGHGPDDFVPKEQVADYFVAYAEKIGAPIRCGVDVTSISQEADGFRVETSEGVIKAANVVSATGAFQRPIIPTVVPAESGIMQMHSHAYRNPAQMPDGAVLVVGAGSSGTQIADELLRAGRKVYLSIGPHDRPPRRYRGHDFVWWLGKLGIWDLKVPAPNTEHVTIAVSGAYGGNTVDFRRLAARGMNLLGRAETYENGVLRFASDLADNIARGDANYLSLLDRADKYALENGLDLPDEPEARQMLPNPDCVTNPTLALDLKASGITAIIWATGYAQDFSWIKADTFDDRGRPVHERGVSKVPGLYFLGLPWLSRRASSFIWGVWHDADYLAGQIAERRQPSARAASAG